MPGIFLEMDRSMVVKSEPPEAFRRPGNR